MAVAALARRALTGRSARAISAVMALGVLGASLFYGDSVITPAISVLSAVEGLEVVSPGLGELVVPIAAMLLGLLFAAQRWGTGRVGTLFGPIMVGASDCSSPWRTTPPAGRSCSACRTTGR